MDLSRERQALITRRQFFGRTRRWHRHRGAGVVAQPPIVRGGHGVGPTPQAMGGMLDALHFAPKAKRVIYLFMSGGPSHIDLFDYKPTLARLHGNELPGSIRMGQRITGMTCGQKSFPCVAPMFKFAQHGQSRHVGQRTAAAHGGDRRRHRASSSR